MTAYDEQSAKIAERMSKIKRKIGIVSGKGGVGKSAVTGILAGSFAKKNKVGLLDADITGPSIPKMFGIKGMPKGTEDTIIPPVTRNGIKLMSMNLLLSEEHTPVIWRGPLLGNTVRQFLSDVEWGELDYLFIDFPPGTGDVPLTIMQSVKLDGIIFVTSPQELALMIVRKTISMAKEMKVPIIGIIENMSYLKCSRCSETLYPFGKSRLDEIAKKIGISVIGKLPIDSSISRFSDSGRIEEYDNAEIRNISSKIEAKLNGGKK
ncbi:MAG: Mrp/NBP35 family ATP-binding protein [Phycisphaerae bacterium]|jgi:Mrp family chromosome partitioning ATPase